MKLQPKLLPKLLPKTFDQTWFAIAGILGGFPCRTDLIAYWADKWLPTANDLKDLAATGTHVAGGGWSLIFTGTEHVAVDTPVTLVGDFEHDFEFRIDAIGSVEAIFGGADVSEGVFAVDASGNPYVYIGSALDTFTDFTLVADTTYVCKLKRVTDQTTLTVNGTGQTHTTLTDDFIIRYIGSWTDGSTNNFSGTQWNHANALFENYLAQGGTSVNLISTVGSNVTCVGFTMATAWSEDYFGHDWANAPGYSEGVTDEVELVTNGLIASIVNSGTSVGTGTGTNTVTIAATGDTASYPRSRITLDSANISGQGYFVSVQLSGDYDNISNIRLGTSGSLLVPDTNGLAEGVVTPLNTASYLEMHYDATQGAGAVTMESVSVEKYYDGKISADPADTTKDMFGNNLTYPGSAQRNMPVLGKQPDLAGTETMTIAHLTGAETVTTSVGTSTPTVVAGGLTFTAGTISYILLSDGTELILEGSDVDGTAQIAAYDVSGGNDGEWVGGTQPIYDTDLATNGGTWLARYGGRLSGNNVIPGTPSGVTLAGDALTFTGPYTESPEGTFTWLLEDPVNPAVYDADGDRQLTAVDGTPERFDPHDYVVPDPHTFLMGTKGSVMTDPEQTGSCLDQTLDEIGIFYCDVLTCLVDGSGNYLIDNSGRYLITE